MVGLRNGEKTLRICATVYTQYRHDRWTDGQTSCHGIVRAMHMHRTVKHGSIFLWNTVYMYKICTKTGLHVTTG